jgi:hypothetical protein
MSKAFSKLQSLGSERVALIDSHFIKGGSAAAIARTIQQEWGQLLDMKSKTLEVSLSRYNKKVVSIRSVVGEVLHNPENKRIRLAIAKDSINTALEIAELIENVKKDIRDTLEKRELLLGDDPETYVSLTSFIRSDMDRLVLWLGKLHTIQVELGIYKKVSSKLELDLNVGKTTAQEFDRHMASLQANTNLREVTLEAFKKISTEYEVLPDVEREKEKK